jgi:hypothetical protein
MIISHLRKFIFIKTFKTGGTSLEIALSKYCGDDDILTPLISEDEKTRTELSGRSAQNYHKGLREHRIRELARLLMSGKRQPKFWEHASANFIRGQVSGEVWNGYFKFAVSRNPYDRTLSRYYFTMNNGSPIPHQHGITNLSQLMRYHPDFVTENWKMCTRSDALIVDDVARYESLESDLDRISRSIGLDRNIYDDLKHIRTKSIYRPKNPETRYRMTEEERSIVRLMCRREFETFGYDPDRVD